MDKTSLGKGTHMQGLPRVQLELFFDPHTNLDPYKGSWVIYPYTIPIVVYRKIYGELSCLSQ